MTSPLPITSAPDDGRKVLVYDHMLGGWHTARWQDFIEGGGAWFVASGAVRLNPSHWKPVDPPPPIEASDDTSGEGA